jgi:hypothetical protein
MKEILERMLLLESEMGAKNKQLASEITKTQQLQSQLVESLDKTEGLQKDLAEREATVAKIEDVVAFSEAAKELKTEAKELMAKSNKEYKEFLELVRTRSASQAKEQDALVVRAKGLNDKEDRLAEGEKKLAVEKKGYKAQVIAEFTAKLK